MSQGEPAVVYHDYFFYYDFFYYNFFTIIFYSNTVNHDYCEARGPSRSEFFRKLLNLKLNKSVTGGQWCCHGNHVMVSNY